MMMSFISVMRSVTLDFLFLYLFGWEVSRVRMRGVVVLEVDGSSTYVRTVIGWRTVEPCIFLMGLFLI